MLALSVTNLLLGAAVVAALGWLVRAIMADVLEQHHTHAHPAHWPVQYRPK
jgi:hypothetical protein